MSGGLVILESLFERAIANSQDREGWLTARALGVTATEVGKLLRGGRKFELELLAAKRAGGQGEDLSYINYIRHGQLREPIIADWVEGRFGITHNETLFHSAENPRHLATPDGVGLNFDEELTLSEIKTSKHDLDPTLAFGKFQTSGYYEQVQWQLYVAGGARSYFVWEQHDDDWSEWPDRAPRPVGQVPRWHLFERDEVLINRLRATADRFLALLDGEK